MLAKEQQKTEPYRGTIILLLLIPGLQTVLAKPFVALSSVCKPPALGRAVPRQLSALSYVASGHVGPSINGGALLGIASQSMPAVSAFPLDFCSHGVASVHLPAILQLDKAGDPVLFARGSIHASHIYLCTDPTMLSVHVCATCCLTLHNVVSVCSKPEK